MKRFKVGIVVAQIFFLLASMANAQKLSLNTTYLNSNNGLSQNTILCILKDKFGFMWFGTQDGLNKYDGFKFTIYKSSRTGTSSLGADLINSICEDRYNNLWVGTRLGGVSRYDRSHDSFVTFKNDHLKTNSLSNDNVQIVYKDRNANLWAGTEDGLNLFDSKTGTFKRYLQFKTTGNDKDKYNITALHSASNNNLWVGTTKGLYLLDIKSGKATRFFDKTTTRNTDNNRITSIIEDEDNNIWIGTKKGLNLLNKQTGTYLYFPIEADKNLSGHINSIFCLASAKSNRFWIGSNTTLQLFDARERRLIPINEKTNGENTMPNDGVGALLEDNAGILWIGTNSEGIVKYDKNLSIFPAYKSSLAGNPSAVNVIRSISEDATGNLYLGTDFGVDYYDRKKGTSTPFKHNVKNINSLSSNYVLSVHASKQTGLVWIGTFASGLDCYNPKTGKFKHLGIGSGPNKIKGKGIYAILEDKDGNIWFTPEDGGVYVYKKSTKKIINYQHDASNHNSVCDNTIQALYEDSHGRIWMGGYSFGISIFDPISQSFKHLNTKNSALTSNVISAFYEDAIGNMWVGTMGGGINCYETKKKQFKSYTEKNGVVNNTINYIAGDAAGKIWLSTIQGIVRLDPISGTSKNYGYHNGLKSLEFNFGTGARLKGGEIALGSINGFNIIDPDNLQFNFNKPKVVLTGFDLFDKPVIPGAKESPLSQSIGSTREIKLNHSQSMFSINFAALDYTIPENNTYAYKMDGFDNEWRYVGSERKATFTNLDPGTYIFRVRAANENGIWNDKQTTIKIIIIPPYWMTWWFRSIIAVILASITYSYFSFKNKAERLQKIELEKQVEARTVEIGKQANDLMKLNEELKIQKDGITVQSKELQQKTKSLETLLIELTEQKDQEKLARLAAESAQLEADKANRAKSTFLATMSHEIRTPLNGVLGMAALLAETDQTPEQEDYTNSIVKSGDSLSLVINDILDFSKIESGNLKLEPNRFDIRKCVDDVLELFIYTATEIGIKLYRSVDELLPQYVIADGLRLRQVLTNLIGNAIKFTNSGEIAIKIKPEYQGNTGGFSLSFEVSDTGIGIKEEQLGNLFQAFNQGDSSITRKYGGTGLGLVICQRLIQLMGGDITVSSHYGIGSTFKFNIYCQQANVESVNDETLNQKSSHSTIEKKSLLSETFALNYPLSILVAEDNLMNQKLILRVLSKLGYKADLAIDGLEVLRLLKNHRYELILMDIQMPNLDGLETTRIIRDTYGSNPKIAAMTANALSEDKENCINAGMDEYMSKPINIEILINQLIALYKKINELNTVNMTENIIDGPWEGNDEKKNKDEINSDLS
ncbi:signal transduction histidine kinase/ligand-binding sensor domain-containing protein/ActR/RegA family two-component response regulator [Mucilaginibacter sp. UYP25]|uniref:hybrid sensor histidine kinase/response regulator n=1 Tax=unclassified Mucilaginibacter TaxID=2617802 RepID=UPI003393E571